MTLETVWPEEVAHIMKSAGWYHERRVSRLVDMWVQELCVDGGFLISQAARQILESFGGLKADAHGPGLRCSRGGFDLTPTLAVGEEERHKIAADELGLPGLFPLGEAYGGHAFLATDADGRIYLLGPSTKYIANNVFAAVRDILIGDI